MMKLFLLLQLCPETPTKNYYEGKYVSLIENGMPFYQVLLFIRTLVFLSIREYVYVGYVLRDFQGSWEIIKLIIDNNNLYVILFNII